MAAAAATFPVVQRFGGATVGEVAWLRRPRSRSATALSTASVGEIVAPERLGEASKSSGRTGIRSTP